MKSPVSRTSEDVKQKSSSRGGPRRWFADAHLINDKFQSGGIIAPRGIA